MTRNTVILLLGAVVLAGACIYQYSGWFSREPIRILVSTGRATGGARAGRGVLPVTFAFDRERAITELKVICLNDPAPGTSGTPGAAAIAGVPVWHLVAKDQPVSRLTIEYGQRIPGLAPAPGYPEKADALQPGKTYRLLVAAGRAKAQVDFQPQAGRR